MKKLALILIGCIFLTACEDETNPAQYQQPPQQYAQQGSDGDTTIINNGGGSSSSGVGEFATGMLLGHMMSGGSNRSSGDYNDNRTIINKHYNTPKPKTNFYGKPKQEIKTYEKPRQTFKTNSSYTTRKSYNSPLSKKSSSRSKRR
ncbi:hypothetical protein [Escherichia phage vB_EcoM_DE16]|nr:hypothetical protein JR324_gp180 [Escherichia phage nieznany]YP_009987010.1 hypothetical protein JR327_gp085 [Escherichia phage Mt1B1_P17]YP_010356238.1 MAG: hypothetical protein M1M20_gp069 [Dompiswa phage TSP7_1]EKQ5213230.1 hypothetical protein [Escherichia coli]QPI12769.1 hypothetical protein [Escherichia phage PNJ1809-36]UKM17308.1 hypothetical protein [Escherichia phage SKA64]UPW38892.1 hypothetical protein ESCO37_00048 [Escherichia phage vB_EcoM_ESCO37]UPW40313.1 hypothetical prote